MIEKACNYFEAFSSKDLDTLTKLYSEDVTLADWKPLFFDGKEQVLDANKTLFESVESVNIVVKRIGSNDKNVFAEIDILINDTTQLFVVDILEFDQNQKIKSIRAYKR
jgi:ketosteroid isomerase-like protein